MVSLNPNPPENFFSDSSSMAIPTVGSFSTAAVKSSSASDDASKKIRKPYTITKSRESWSDPEHDKFLEALQLGNLLQKLPTRNNVYQRRLRGRMRD